MGFASTGICFAIAAAFAKSRTSEVLMWAGLFSFVIFILGAAGRGLVGRCVHCRKYFDGFSAQIAIATGRCGFCGEPAFAEEQAKQSA
jgi:hypothetical protein